MNIYIILYLIGDILAYFLYRKHWKSLFKSYTVGDRAFGLFVALFSWITAFVVICSIISSYPSNFWNKAAKW